MCISEMQMFLQSLGVASVSGEVPELFCRRRFGAAVEMDFEHGLKVDQVTSLMNDNVGQQKVACGGAARLAGRKATVCGSLGETKRQSACCEQRERSVCCERRGHD